MSDVSSISAAATLAPRPAERSSTQASPSFAKDKAEPGGSNLPPVSVSTKPEASESKKQENQQTLQENIQAAVAQMNEYVQSSQRDLQFSFDEASGETIVKVLDRETQEVIRQIPDEVFLKLARRLSADEPVQLFSGQA